jgi:hypothetical protein
MKDSRYFQHDSNARNDPKITTLVELHGLEAGYRYWCFIEVLREHDNYRLDCSKKFNLVALQRELQFHSTNEVGAFLQVLVELELLRTSENGFLYSTALTRRMNNLETLRSRRSDAGKKGGIASAEKKEQRKGLLPHSSNAQANLFPSKQRSSNAQAMLKQPSSNAQAVLNDVQPYTYSSTHLPTYLPNDAHAEMGVAPEKSEEERTEEERTEEGKTEPPNEPPNESPNESHAESPNESHADDLRAEREEQGETYTIPAYFWEIAVGTLFQIDSDERLYRKMGERIVSFPESNDRHIYPVNEPETVVFLRPDVRRSQPPPIPNTHSFAELAAKIQRQSHNHLRSPSHS